MKQWEYYCHGCKQLRLYVSRNEEKPCKCARCSSDNIQIGEIGCPELTKLRYRLFHRVLLMIYPEPHRPACTICNILADTSDGFIPIGWRRIAFTAHIRIASEVEGKATFMSSPSSQSLYCCAECHEKHPRLVLTLSVIAPSKEQKEGIWPVGKN